MKIKKKLPIGVEFFKSFKKDDFYYDPVISISLKDVEGRDFQTAYDMLEIEKAAYLHNSLRLLTELLFKHYGIQTIVLIDEYDVPLDKAYQDGFYEEMVRLIRSLFSQVFKTNPNMYFAVITGCLWIAKESIFTGLNNFKVRMTSDIDFAEYFGFTDHEVKVLSVECD